ncbi:hypothetical protein [Streptomyces alfalfae]
MHDQRTGHTSTPDSALPELRRRLESGLAKVRLKKTDLVARTGVSRTVVQQVFQADGPVPSARTATALAGALRLPVENLLDLQRVAAGEGSVEKPGPGWPIGQWDPHALEVHLSGAAQDGAGLSGQRLLPGAFCGGCNFLRPHLERLFAREAEANGGRCTAAAPRIGRVGHPLPAGRRHVRR